MGAGWCCFCWRSVSFASDVRNTNSATSLAPPNRSQVVQLAFTWTHVTGVCIGCCFATTTSATSAAASATASDRGLIASFAVRSSARSSPGAHAWPPLRPALRQLFLVFRFSRRRNQDWNWCRRCHTLHPLHRLWCWLYFGLHLTDTTSCLYRLFGEHLAVQICSGAVRLAPWSPGQGTGPIPND